LNEKEVAFQTTSPPTYVVADIHVLDGQAGRGYERGQKVTTAGGKIDAVVEEVDGYGGIVRLWWDETKAYDENPETVSPGTVDADDQDEFGDLRPNPDPVQDKKPLSFVVLSPKTGTGYAYVRVVTRYAPGSFPVYGTLAHANRHDPLVQASYMTGYVERKLTDAVVMKFVGYVSQHDPRWPWSETVYGGNVPVVQNRPPTSPRGVVPKLGDLWYVSAVEPVKPPLSGTGDIPPESALPDTAFPWGGSAKNLLKWDGFKWVEETTEYRPESYRLQ
jgi:hypothetical protein